MRRVTKRRHKNYNYLLQELKRQQRKKKREKNKENNLTNEKKCGNLNTKENIKENIQGVKSMDFDFKKIVESIDLLNSVLPEIRELATSNEVLYEHLNQELSTVDTEISDIIHAIEFGNFNASEGYKLAKTLQVARNKRREIKSKIEVADSLKQLKNNIKKPEVNSLIQTIQSQSDKLGKKKSYIVRTRTDLNTFMNSNNKSTKEILVKNSSKGVDLK